jgi:hypothetical protein
VTGQAETGQAGQAETTIGQLRKIVADRQHAVVDGTAVDLFTASAIIAVHDKLSPDNQRKFAAMPVPPMASLALGMISRGAPQ